MLLAQELCYNVGLCLSMAPAPGAMLKHGSWPRSEKSIHTLLIMVLPPILTRYHQRIGDMVARSVVINAKILMPPLPQETPDDPNAT